MIHPSPFSGPTFRGLRIGLMGGSFNPAHAGHKAMSLHALKRLKLDQVWWLVSPQNPLKSSAGMKPFSMRLDAARTLVRAHPRVVVSDLEARLGTRYTYDTLCALRQRFPQTRFVWLMGADNLRIFHRWRRGPELFSMVPIAVFRRSSYAAGGARGKTAHRFQAARMETGAASVLVTRAPPVWLMLDNPLSALSSTALRQGE